MSLGYYITHDNTLLLISTDVFDYFYESLHYTFLPYFLFFTIYIFKFLIFQKWGCLRVHLWIRSLRNDSLDKQTAESQISAYNRFLKNYSNAPNIPRMICIHDFHDIT